jgi:signal transduction histidine kinase
MIAHRIRWRMVWVAVLPIALVVVCIAVAFWFGRSKDLEEAHRQRVDLLVRQVALFGGYGLFSGDRASLQSVVNAVKDEPDVAAVHVYGTDGVLIASAGATPQESLVSMGLQPYQLRRQAEGFDSLREPIFAARLPVDDFFLDGNAKPSSEPLVLGYVVLEVSRAGLQLRKSDALVTTTWLGLLAVMLGTLLAIRLGNGVVRPILRVSHMVRRIAQGDFGVQPDVAATDPLHELQTSLNQMAIRLAWGRDEMAHRVAVVTEALRIKKEQAEEATQAKSHFLASASHDLRQPTHALGLFVARLQQFPMEPQQRQLVDSLDASVRSLQDLLDGFLDLSRLEAGSVSAHLQPVSVGALLESLRPILEPSARAKGLRLRIRPSNWWVRSDPVLLHRMVMNLALNAVRYTERGTVLIACRLADGGQGVRIEVWDSGIGIAPDHQQDIFREFFQVNAKQPVGRGRPMGLGLGLSIVERTAKLLDCRLELRSAAGCGTRFSIILNQRIAAVAEQVSPAERRAEVFADLAGVRVLLLEDDNAARLAARALLESWGCMVFAAATAQQACAVVQSEGIPDIIVSDYHLGGGDNGLHAIAVVRDLAQYRVHACLMSGDTDVVVQQNAKSAGLTLLQKPVRPAKLRSLLRRFAASPGTGGARLPD